MLMFKHLQVIPCDDLHYRTNKHSFPHQHFFSVVNLMTKN